MRFFLNCGNLQEIILPSTIKTIGEFAFSGCGVKSLLIPDSVEKLGAGCFSLCGKLKTIGMSVGTKIGNLCFGECRNLKFIFFLGGEKEKTDPRNPTRKELENWGVNYNSVEIINNCRKEAFVWSRSAKKQTDENVGLNIEMLP